MMRRALAPDAAIIRFAPGRFPPVWGNSFLQPQRCPINTAKIAIRTIKSIGDKVMGASCIRIEYSIGRNCG